MEKIASLIVFQDKMEIFSFTLYNINMQFLLRFNYLFSLFNFLSKFNINFCSCILFMFGIPIDMFSKYSNKTKNHLPRQAIV